MISPLDPRTNKCGSTAFKRLADFFLNVWEGEYFFKRLEMANFRTRQVFFKRLGVWHSKTKAQTFKKKVGVAPQQAAKGPKGATPSFF